MNQHQAKVIVEAPPPKPFQLDGGHIVGGLMLLPILISVVSALYGYARYRSIERGMADAGDFLTGLLLIALVALMCGGYLWLALSLLLRW